MGAKWTKSEDRRIQWILQQNPHVSISAAMRSAHKFDLFPGREAEPLVNRAYKVMKEPYPPITLTCGGCEFKGSIKQFYGGSTDNDCFIMCPKCGEYDGSSTP